MMLVIAAGFEVWLAIAVGLLLLTGVTALGGVRLLVPCALVVGTLLIVRSSRMPGTQEISLVAIASGVLVFSFLLGLASLSFSRVRQLHDHRRLALLESATLRHRNTRLARYLPDDVEPLISARPAGVYRPRDHFATVAFVDVVGFVELVASRPLGELVDVVNDFISMVTALTEQRGGILNKFLGDGVLIYFPEGAGDSPDERWRAAARCAQLCLDLGPGLNELAATWRRRGLTVDLHARSGIASGYCAIGDWGGGDRIDFTLIGTPVNLASRLQAQAPPGGVLLSTASAALIREDLPLAECLGAEEMRQIKGFGTCLVHELTASDKVRANRLPGPAGTTHG